MTIAQLIKELREHNVVLRLESEKLLCELPKQGIPAALKSELVARKEELKTYIAEMMSDKINHIAIPRRPEGDYKVPLSFAQQRLWLMDQIDGSSTHANMAYALRLKGEVDYEAISYAFSVIVERHQSLRTNVHVDNDGEPYQVIQSAANFHLQTHDLSLQPEASRELLVDDYINKEMVRAFNLKTDLMLSVQLLKTSIAEHVLLITMHHIASDGWSMAILLREFNELYSSHTQGKNHRLPYIDIQYADYAYWQRNWLQHEVLDKQISYWKNKLISLPPVHNLPLDYARPKVQSFKGKRYFSTINSTSVQALNALCVLQGATLFMGLQSIFAVLLARYSNEQDIVMGSLIANREQIEIAGLIGCFFNAQVLRNDLSGNPDFNTLLNESKSMLLDAYAHQQVPFEQVVECLQPERNLGYNPLFQVLLIMQNTEVGTLQLPNLELEFITQERNSTVYDLRLDIVENSSGLSLCWEYRTDLFKPSTIERMANHFETLLGSILKNPQENVLSLNMLSDDEHEKLLYTWNSRITNYPLDLCIHQLFETQVKKTPNAIAVVVSDQVLTYNALNEKSNQLAHYLITEKGVTPDTLVGICVDASLDMIVAILGILKAGAAYVPLDSSYPESRLAYMLSDAKLSIVITQRHVLERIVINASTLLCIDDLNLQQQLEQQPKHNIDPHTIQLLSNHLAYIIYTSGSTGNPKGVAVERKSLRNLINWYIDEYKFNDNDAFYIVSAIGFDLTQKNLFAPLLVGGRLVLSARQYFDPEIILGDIEEHAVTVMNCAPSAFYPLIESDKSAYEALRSLRYLLLGGEPINSNLLKHWTQSEFFNCKIINMYGPTECADITTQQVHDIRTNSTKIGRQINNVSAYVVNSFHQLSPVNVPGELLIGGVGLARGYLHNPDLTAQKFISNPFYDKNNFASSERLYKTGDLVRWLPDGNLEFLGRIDHQVKIRGFRIELGEIENFLTEHTHVKDALVLVKEFSQGDNRLIAYLVVAEPGAEVNKEIKGNSETIIEQVTQYLRQSVPDYMVPSVFVLLDKLPLTPNGKVDRKALPEPNFNSSHSNFCAPETDVEKIICSVWQEVLGVNIISTKDSFFALGGNSLLAIRALSKVNEQCQVVLSIRSLFLDPTVSGIAKVIDTMKLNTKNLHSLAENELVEEGFF